MDRDDVATKSDTTDNGTEGAGAQPEAAAKGPAPADKGDQGKPTGQDKAPAKAPTDSGAMYDDDEDGDEPPAKAPKGDSGDWKAAFLTGLEGDQLKTATSLLERRRSPQDVMRSWLNAENKIRTGEYKKGAPGEDATPEEVAEWRASMGIPKDPAEYKLPQIAGHDWSDADKQVIGVLNAKMHGANATQGQIDAALGFYVETVQKAREQQAAQDLAAKEAIEDKRRAEYGARYRPMNALVNRLMKDPEAVPAGLSETLMNARDPKTGVLLRHHPEFSRWMDDMAIARYGDAGLITGEESAAISNRKAEIQKIMREDNDRYWREGLNVEYSEILAKEGKSKR